MINLKRGRLAQILFFVFREGLTFNRVPQEFQPVYNYYLSCIEDETLYGSTIAGQQGGYIDIDALGFSPGSIHMPFSNQLDFLGNSVPYWYYISGNGVVKEQVPSKEKIETELNGFVEERLPYCDFSSFIEQGYRIELSEVAEVSTRVNENNILVNVEQPLNIYFGNDSYRATSHEKKVDSNFGKFYDLAQKIYQDNKKSLFLENYGVDILRLYAPVDGNEIGCSPKIWNIGAVRENLTSALEANTGFIKIKGDYYTVKKENEYFVHDIGENVDANVNFLYLREWPMKVEVWPSDGSFLRADPIGLEEGYGILGFCYVPYHFVYDFVYPVLVQIYYEDELFQFPVVVYIEKNKPREADNVESRVSAVPELCLNRNTRVNVKTVDRNFNPVPADISFACFDTICPIGRSMLSNGDALLETDFPQCVNGFIVARAEGYETFRYKATIIEEQTINLALNKEYEMKLDVRKNGRPLASEDYAIVYFSKNNLSKIVSYPETSNVSLAEGQYQIKTYIYSNTELTIDSGSSSQCVDVPISGVFGLFGVTEKKCFDVAIPSQSINVGITGGGLQNYFVTEQELADARTIVIDADDFGTPSKIQDLQINFERIDASRMNVYLS
ncbi:hypothetical protein J4456_04205 [Candidatus Pacearchaeota archaeon]|nr:hypothetical protein [Candidatus Pacearchaeota archaeon]